MRERNSSIVTSEPSRFQTEPSSRPIAPAPITTSFFGASVNSNASVLLTIVLPSNFANGNSTGARPIDHDTVLRRLFFDEHEMIARGKKRFARNAAHVQARAAQFFAFLDKGRLQPKLAGADGSNITPRSGADDNNIKFFHMRVLS